MVNISSNKPVVFITAYQRRKPTKFLHQQQSSFIGNWLKNSKRHLENNAENSDLFLKLVLMKFKPDSEISKNRLLKFSKPAFKTVKAQFRASTKHFKKIPEINSVNATMRNASKTDATKQAKNSVNELLRLDAQLLPHEQCAIFVNGFEQVVAPRRKQSAANKLQRRQFNLFSKGRD
jgi:hypothetical protein